MQSSKSLPPPAAVIHDNVPYFLHGRLLLVVPSPPGPQSDWAGPGIGRGGFSPYCILCSSRVFWYDIRSVRCALPQPDGTQYTLFPRRGQAAPAGNTTIDFLGGVRMPTPINPKTVTNPELVQALAKLHQETPPRTRAWSWPTPWKRPAFWPLSSWQVPTASTPWGR